MAKFFRKIRQKLLAENKFSRYVVYALGEIVLVVIGILIALQINNWNNSRIKNQEEKQSYRQIRRQITDDMKEIKQVKDLNQF